MIFNKNNLVLTNKTRGYRKYRYSYSDNENNRGIEILCFANSPMGPRRGYTYWLCDILIDELENHKVGKFQTSAPWKDKTFLNSLATYMNSGGKQKLIRAIYNDFGD